MPRHIHYIFISILTTSFISDVCGDGTFPKWKLLGPGDADQITSLNVLENGDVFAGLDVAGIYISTDSGDSWRPSNTGLNNLDVTTRVIQDPNNMETLFVGTRGGLYKSIDYGKIWTRKSNGLPKAKKHSLSGSIGSILIDPFNDKIVYTAMGYRPSSNGTATVKKINWSNHIYKSFDGGDNWSKKTAFSTPSKVTQLFHSPKFKNTLYAATSTGLYISKDAGIIWSRILDKNTLNITIDKNHPNTIYAACDTDGVYKSLDNGISWRPVNNGLSFFNYGKKFANRYSIIMIDPADTDRLYVINSTWGRAGGLYRSINAGKKWEFISSEMPESWLKTSRRMNDIAITINDSNKIYLGSSRYIYSSNDAGNTWNQNISKKISGGWGNRGINVFGQTRDVQVDYNDKDTIYIATADHKMVVSNNSGISWNLLFRGDKNASNIWDIEMCKIKPYDLLLITSGTSKELCLYKKTETNKWEKSCGNFGTSKRYEKITTSPFDCNTIIIVTNDKLYRSTDAGESWNLIYPDKKITKIYFITFDRYIKSLAYIGTSNGLFESTDSGMTWNKVESTEDLVVTSIFSDQKNNQFLIGTKQTKKNPGAIYKSHNNGRHWIKTLDNIVKYVTAIVADTHNNNILYASTMDHNYHDLSKGSGIFMSKDAGNTWVRIDQSLPVHRGYNMSVSYNRPNEVFFSSAGSGAYQLKLND